MGPIVSTDTSIITSIIAGATAEAFPRAASALQHNGRSFTVKPCTIRTDMRRRGIGKWQQKSFRQDRPAYAGLFCVLCVIPTEDILRF